jgi:hypothetical protein
VYKNPVAIVFYLSKKITEKPFTFDFVELAILGKQVSKYKHKIGDGDYNTCDIVCGYCYFKIDEGEVY